MNGTDGTVKVTPESCMDAAAGHCRKLDPAGEGDYFRDGLLYCGKCHTPRECVIAVPNTKRTLNAPVVCACRKAERERDRAEACRKAADERRKQALPLEKYRHMTFAASDTPLVFAVNYVARWEEMLKNNVGLLLHGAVGSGKTYAAAAIANALVDKGEWVYMHNIAAMNAALRDTYRGGHADLTERAQTSRLFVIDDFGAESVTPYSLQLTYELVEARAESGRPLIVTTNLSPAAVAGTDDPSLSRLYSRLASLHPVGITGPDRRRAATRQRYDEINGILGIEE